MKMKAVMMSIQPKWCEFIASGKKTVEVRKTRPKIETPFKVYIYCTLQGSNEFFKDTLGGDISKWNKGKWGNKKGKVIGEFVCDEIEILRRNTIFNAPALYSQSCLTREEYFNYIGNKTAYIWHISNLVIYDQPKELSEFRILCKYRNEDGSCQYRKVECDCVKFDFNPDYSVNLAECCDYMTRPPQSWCYVEELK